MPSTTRPIGGEGPLILGILWFQFVLATFFMGLRTYTWAKISHNAGLALVVAAVSWWMGFGSQIVFTVGIAYGFGNNDQNLNQFGTASKALGISWPAILVAIIGVAVGKIAVCIFLVGLQGPLHKKGKWFLIFCAAFNFVVAVATGFVNLLQCQPVSALWNNDGECDIKQADKILGYVNGGVGGVTDVIFATYPIFLFWDMQMPKRIKVSLFILLGLGYIPAACAFGRIQHAKALGDDNDAQDRSVNLTPFAIWQWTELWTVLICGSAPPAWPLIKPALLWCSQPFKSAYKSARRSSKGSEQPIEKKAAPLGDDLSESDSAKQVQIRGPKDYNDIKLPDRDRNILMRKEVSVELEQGNIIDEEAQTAHRLGITDLYHSSSGEGTSSGNESSGSGLEKTWSVRSKR